MLFILLTYSRPEELRVCAYNNETGLQNFDNPCEIVFKNCEVRRPIARRYAFDEQQKVKGMSVITYF